MNQQTMAMPDGVVRTSRRPANPLRVGLVVAISVIIIHALGGNFANEWEGWGVALQTVSFAAVFGALVLGLTFGVLVRRGLRRQRTVATAASTQRELSATLRADAAIATVAPARPGLGGLVLVQALSPRRAVRGPRRGDDRPFARGAPAGRADRRAWR